LLQKIYANLTTKQEMLMKTYAANYNIMLKAQIKDVMETGAKKGTNDTGSGQFTPFFISGVDVVKCCLPFKIYSRKLANNMS